MLAARIAHDRVRERMVAPGLDRQRKREQVLRLDTEGFDVGHDRTALGDRAGLVQNHTVYIVQVFQRLGGLEQHAVFRAHARACLLYTSMPRKLPAK